MLTEYTAFEEEKCMRIAWVDLSLEEIKWKQWILRRSSVEENQKGPLPAEVGD
jgi:hypothetical protein